MLKPTLVATTLLASTLPSCAQAGGDPTFNGLVDHATCYVRNLTVCRSSSCAQALKSCQGDLCGTLDLFLSTRQYRTTGESKPLEITGISPAEVGKPLWVTFNVLLKAGRGDGQLTLLPERLGGYVTPASVYVGAADDPGGRSFSLINFDCEQVPDGP